MNKAQEQSSMHSASSVNVVVVGLLRALSPTPEKHRRKKNPFYFLLLLFFSFFSTKLICI